MISWFEKLVGKENISDELIDLEVYSTDASQIRGRADKVVWVNEAFTHIFGFDIEEIKDKIDIAELVSGYVTLQKAGANFRGLCRYI